MNLYKEEDWYNEEGGKPVFIDQLIGTCFLLGLV